MKKTTFLLCLLTFLLASVSIRAQLYQTLQVQSGFTDDVIAEASPASTTSSSPVDATTSGANFAFMSTTYTGATVGLPVNGLINSAATAGLIFQLAPYTANNSLRINANGGTGTLLFQNTVKAKRLFILTTSGSANSTFTGVITFTDNSTQAISSQTVYDWYTTNNGITTISGIGRVARTTGSPDNNSSNPRLFQVPVTIDVANLSKEVKSIQFTKTSSTAGFLNIFGVSAEIAENCPSPETTTFSALSITGATATWTVPTTVPGQGYLYELRTSGAAGSGATGLVLSETVTGLTKTFSNLTPSTVYSFYIKSVCSGTESSAWRLGGNFTTNVLGQIGSGTATSSNFPITSNWSYNYTQQIFTKQQIDAVVYSGSTYIRKIRFFYNGTASDVTSFNNWTVYLGNTTKTEFSSNTDWIALTALQQTYSGTVTFPAPGNWMEITFDTPFQWNGTDNLVVAVKEQVDNYGTSVSFRSFTSGSNTGIYYRSDTAIPNPASPPTANGRTGSINQIQLNAIAPIACTGVPNAGTALPATQTLCSSAASATISVQDVNEVLNISYKWQESDDNGVTDAWADVTTGIGATTLNYTPVAFTGTSKFYRLKTTCTVTGEVAYSSVSSILNYTAPTTLAANMLFSAITDTSMKIDWTNGNGMRRMVVVNTTNSFTDPISGSGAAITTNTIFAGAGQQIVYDGTGTTVTISGLNCSTTYYVRVYEYNRCGSAAPFTFWYAASLNGSQATTVTTLPTTVNNLSVNAVFTGFTTTGDNLTTVSPGWTERSGDGPFTASTSTWRGGATLNGAPTARINLFTNTKKDWIISPLTNVNVSARVKFKAAITAYNVLTPHTNGMQTTDDKVEVMISTDACGTAWTPLFTFNAANTTTLTNVLTDFEVPIPVQYVGQNVRIGFKASDGPLDDGPDYDFHIANVTIEPQPTCADTFGVVSANITKNSVTISWSAATPVPANGYEYEIRTIGAPGTAGALQTGTTAEGIITKDITLLSPATTYFVYIRAVCDTATKGNWSSAHSFVTLCDYPDLTAVTGDTICGTGTAQLSANAGTGIVKWYAAATGGTPLHTGVTFTTPEITATTTYYAESGGVVPNIITQVGTGTTSSSGPGQSPYHYYYGGYKHQYIYTSQELTAAGLAAGEINSVGFNLVTGSSVNRNDFTIHIGTTTQNTATSTHVSGLTQVYSNAAQPMVVGINTYPFTTPFVWDGTSNIVVQVNWSNNNGGAESNSGSVRYHTTSASQCTYTYADNKTAAQILATATGTVAGSGGTTTSTSRANTYFNGFGICSSPRAAVVATVNAAPGLALSSTQVTICNGASSAPIIVTTGATDYDIYTWSPATGVSGNATDGFIFNPTVSTSYELTASQSGGSLCKVIKQLQVNVNEVPEFQPLPDETLLCAGQIHELNSAALPGLINLADETFSGGTSLPANWQAQGGEISISTSNAAGGTANELKITGDSFTNITRRASYGPIDTSNLEQVTLQWQNHLSHYSSAYNYSVKVQTSSNGTTWNNTSWVTNPVTASQAASLSSVTINNADVGSSTFYFAFTVEGADFGMNNWNIDNVVLKAPQDYPVLWEPVENLYTDPTATIPYTTGTTANKVYFKSVNGMAATNYIATITNIANCSVSNSTFITVKETSAPTVNITAYCINSTLADVSASATTAIGMKWYSAATAGNELPSTTLLVNGSTYYASQTVDGCESIARTPVTVVVYDTPAPTRADTTPAFCIQSNATLADIVVDGTDIKWYDAATAGNQLPLTTVLTNETSYYAAQTLNNCESVTRLEIQVSLTETVAPTASATTQLFCTISNSTLANVAVNGTDIKWYDASVNGNELPATTLLVNGTTYFASQTADSCESVERLAIETIIDDIAAPTTANTMQIFCIQTNPTLSNIQVTGTDIKWYSTATNGSPIDSSIALTNGTTYYASQTVTGCESDDRLAITVQIQNTAAPTTTLANQAFCIQDQATLNSLNVSGTGIIWYNTATSVTALPANTLLTTGTYYATQTLNGCESTQRLAVNVAVTNVATPTTTNAVQAFCLNTNPTIANLVISGTNIKWYNSSTGGIELPVTAPLVHNQIYYAVQSVNNCESATRLAITANVFNTEAPSAANTNPVFCIQTNATLNNIQVTGSGVKWYITQSGGTALSPATALVNGTTYYASQTANGCESTNRLAITVHVQDTAVPTTTSPNQSFCAQDQPDLNDLIVSGIGIKWYNVETGGNELPTNTILTSGTYYAAQTVNGCESPTRLAINVTVTNVATPTTGLTVQMFCSQELPTLASLTVNETSVKWYATAIGGNELALNTPLVHNQQYYAAQVFNNCESALRLEITAQVYNTQAPTTANTSQSFCSFNNPKLSDISVDGMGVKWYTSMTGGIALANTTSLVDGTTYYASQTENGCESAGRLAVNVTVSNNPVITTNSLTVCSGTILSDIVIEGLTFSDLKWYASANATTALSATTVLSNGTFYVSTYSINLCESARKPIQVTVNVVPQPTAETQIFCGSATVANLIAQGVANATFNWYNNAQSTSPLALTTPLSTGTYYVDQVVNGCKSVKKVFSVTVVNTAAPNVNSYTLCEGSTINDLVLPTGGGVTFFWYTSATSTSPLQLTHVLNSGVYFVERIHHGCVSERKLVNITITPKPQTPTGNSVQTFVDSATVSDLVLNETDVVWYNSLYDAENGIDPLAETVNLTNGHTYYAVTVSGQGCRSIAFAVNVIITLATKDLDLVHLKYFPNPVESELNITYIEPIKSVEVYTILGQKVTAKTFETKDVKIDLSNLSSGSYVVRIVTESASQFIKIIKK